jgi:hypothetical protein
MASIVDLSNLRAALRADPDATASLPDRTWRRVARGEFGAQLLWWLEHPKILAALAKDAASWTEADLERIREASGKRAEAQREYRKAQKAKPKGRKK